MVCQHTAIDFVESMVINIEPIEVAVKADRDRSMFGLRHGFDGVQGRHIALQAADHVEDFGIDGSPVRWQARRSDTAGDRSAWGPLSSAFFHMRNQLAACSRRNKTRLVALAGPIQPDQSLVGDIGNRAIECDGAVLDANGAIGQNRQQ